MKLILSLLFASCFAGQWWKDWNSFPLGAQCKYDLQCSGSLLCRSSKCALPSPPSKPADCDSNGATRTKTSTRVAKPTTTSVKKVTRTPVAKPTTTSVKKVTRTPAAKPTTTSVIKSTPTPAAKPTTTSVKKSTPTPAPITQPGSSPAKLFLYYQNECRGKVGIPDFSWSSSLESDARQYASYLANSNGCKLKHAIVPGYGENLYWTSNKNEQEVEKKSINAYCSEPLTELNHHTQVVWKNTLKTGCASVSSDCGTVSVCRYFPPGNYVGESYRG